MYSLQYSIYELLWLFFVYSLAGWCAGVAVGAVKRRKFINTGVLNLPLCPIYGVSGVLYSVFLVELKDSPVFLFLAGAILTSALTVINGISLERIFHRRWRDYSELRFGFGGFITAPLFIAYGLLAVAVLWIGNPVILKVISLMPYDIGRLNLLCLLGLMAVDLSGVLAVVWKWRRHINRMAGITGNMQLVSTTFGNVITRTIRRRLEKSYPNIETSKILEAKAAQEPKKKTKFAEGCGFYKLAGLFLIGAFLGDIVETVFCRITMGWWMSRSSVVYGPFSIVWGLACALLTAFLYKYRNKSDRYIFLYGTVVGGVYEYLCSVFTELVFGTVFWNYSKIPFNIGGRVNLLYCFFWGIAAVLWLKGIYPFLSGLIEKIPRKIGPVLMWIMIVFMVFNMAVSSVALARYSQRQKGVEAADEFTQLIDERFPNERMEKIYPKARIVEK